MTSINQGSVSKGSYKLLSDIDSADKPVQNDSSNEIPDEREDPHLLSGLQCSMMIFKFCVGIGWFSLPASFQHSGLLMGIFLNLFCGALTMYGMLRLVESSWEVVRRTGKTTAYYGDIGAACGRLLNEKWGLVGRLTVDVILSVSAFCLLCPLVLFVADIWKQAFEEQDIVKMDISIWISIAYIFIFPSTFIRRPDFLAWFALVANILEFIMTLCVFVNIFSRTSSWKVNNTVTWSKLPLSIGIIFFAFEIAPFILSVENITRKPKQLPRVINIVMIGISLIYSFIGSVGFMSCYPDCKDSIILNLPTEWYFSVAKVLMGIGAICGAVLISFVLYNVVEPILKAQVPEDRFYLVSQLFRIFVLTFSSAVTASVPQLGNIMSLAGSIVTGLIGFLLPAMSHTLLLYNQISRFTIAANFVFSIFGLLFLFSGVYTSIVEIVNDY